MENKGMVPMSGLITERPVDIPSNIPTQDWTIVREWLRSKRSEYTKKMYGRNISMFYQKRYNRPLSECTLTELQDYRDVILFEYPEPATQAQILATVKSLMTFAHRTGALKFNVGAALQLPQGKDKLAERILEPSQLYKIIDKAKETNIRNYTLIVILYGSGIRCSELCTLHWKDVQLNREGGQITVMGKRNKTRSITLHPKIWQILQDYKPDQASGPVFPSRQASTRNYKETNELTPSRVWQIVSSIAKDAGIEGVSAHWLRHTHATKALENHVSLKLLQETLGHTSLATTGRYTHVRPDDSSSMYIDF